MNIFDYYDEALDFYGKPPTEGYFSFPHESESTIVDNEFVITINSKYVDTEGLTKITEAILEMLERTKDD